MFYIFNIIFIVLIYKIIFIFCIIYLSDLLLLFLFYLICTVFFFKQKTAYEMRISDWSSDVCSSDLSDLTKGVADEHHCHQSADRPLRCESRRNSHPLCGQRRPSECLSRSTDHRAVAHPKLPCYHVTVRHCWILAVSEKSPDARGIFYVHLLRPEFRGTGTLHRIPAQRSGFRVWNGDSSRHLRGGTDGPRALALCGSPALAIAATGADGTVTCRPRRTIVRVR